MLKSSVMPVVLSGGSGSRLWPLSRTGFPKQFLIIDDNKKSYFQQAVERVSFLYDKHNLGEKMLIVSGEEQRFLVLDQLRELSCINPKIILEPEGRNTAPALTIASLQALKKEDDPILVVISADQLIEPVELFHEALEKCIGIAKTGAIALIGIKPTSPDSGFGYIKHEVLNVDKDPVDVDNFFEKPDIETAKKYSVNQNFSWNAGIFVLKARVWLDAIKKFRPDIYDTTKKAFEFSRIDNDFIRVDDRYFREVPSESIDYAVMEKCPGSEFKVKMIRLDATWSDLGSWNAVWNISEKDEKGNVIFGDVIAESSNKNLIYSSNRLVAVAGVNNLAIIETADAIMVVERSDAQCVRDIVNRIVFDDREEHILHRKVSRPWGWYDTIDAGNRFKVKRIQVNPGASLSLQEHNQRAEHWVVVRGVAEIICGEKVLTLKENESTFIPIGVKHRLSNPSCDVLEIIEVQSGEYLGEDEIVRFEDQYGRNRAT